MAEVEKRIRIKSKFKSIHFYSFFKKNHPDIKITNVQYSKIWGLWVKKMMMLCIYKNIEIPFFSNLGSLRVQKKPKKIVIRKDGKLDFRYTKIDLKATLEYWKQIYPGKTKEDLKRIANKKKIYFLNKHTDGNSYSFLWDRITSSVENQRLYRFRAARQWNRELAKGLKDESLHLDFYL